MCNYIYTFAISWSEMKGSKSLSKSNQWHLKECINIDLIKDDPVFTKGAKRESSIFVYKLNDLHLFECYKGDLKIVAEEISI